MTQTRSRHRTIASLALTLAASTAVPGAALGVAPGMAPGVAPSLPAGASVPTECGTPSPTFERLGADYVLLDRHALPAIGGIEPFDRPSIDGGEGRRSDASRRARLLEILRTAALDGIDGERIRCRGEGDAVREVRWLFDLEQLERVEMLNGRTVLVAFEARHTTEVDARGTRHGDDRLVDGTRVAEIMDVPSADAWRPGADRASLRSVHRFRQAGASSASCDGPLPGAGIDPGSSSGVGSGVESDSCGFLTEIDTTARAVGHAVEIEQVRYTDGRLSERALWRIRP